MNASSRTRNKSPPAFKIDTLLPGGLRRPQQLYAPRWRSDCTSPWVRRAGIQEPGQSRGPRGRSGLRLEVIRLPDEADCRAGFLANSQQDSPVLNSQSGLRQWAVSLVVAVVVAPPLSRTVTVTV